MFSDNKNLGSMVEDVKIADNMEIHEKEKFVFMVINPKIHPLPVIQSAAYVMTDSTYVILDGDPEKEIMVQLRPKDADSNLEELGRKFSEELLNYDVYMVMSEKTRDLRNMIFHKALQPAESSVTGTNSAAVQPSAVHHVHAHDPDTYGRKWENHFKKDENERDTS